TELDGPHGAGVDADRSEALVHQVRTAVALAHASFGLDVLRNPVGAGPHAVPAADAGILVEDDQAVIPLDHGTRRAVGHALGILAVVARHGEVVDPRVGVLPALKGVDPPKDGPNLQVVLVFTGDLAGLAGDARRHVQVESELTHASPSP